MKINKVKRIIIALVTTATFIVLAFIFCYKITPINLKQEEIRSISINIELSSPEKSISGMAEINNYNKIKDAIQVINSLKVSTEKNLDKKLGGDSPSAWMHTYDEKGYKIDSIYFYYDILRYNEEYYKVSISQYDKLAELCSKYGECSTE